MNLLKLNLHLFGEGGGAAGGGDGAAAGTAGGETATGAAPAMETQADTRTAEERAAAFEELIKNEYAQEFNARTQGIINERFKGTKALEKQLSDMQPILDALSTKYGESDHKKLAAAIEADESFYRDAADEEGLSVEQYKRMRELERKANAFDEAQRQRERVATEQRAFAQWDQQSQQVKQIYPGFDFKAECQDPQTGPMFIKLLGQGVDVKTAYEVVKHDELISGALQSAVTQAQQKTVQTIRARGMRPSENGVGGSVATQMVKVDPAKMTKQERAKYAQRALAGERIDFTSM